MYIKHFAQTLADCQCFISNTASIFVNATAVVANDDGDGDDGGCYSLVLKCSSKACVMKAWSPTCGAVGNW